MRGNYLIAVCDILGFSALVANKPLEEVIDGSITWFRRALNHSILKKSFPDSAPPTAELDGNNHVGVAWFSDTILLYTKEDTDEAVRELLQVVAWLVFETILDGKTMIRAGIAYGEAYIEPENSIYIGKAIIDAYELEKIQEWAGAALCSSAVLRIPELARSGKFVDWWVVPWAVPLKHKQTMLTLAINWNLGIHAPDWRLRWSRKSDMPEKSDWATNKILSEKFMNTKLFHEAHCIYCRSLP